MRNEAFYSTAAQVLPALLIALLVQMSAVLRAHLRVFAHYAASNSPDRPGSYFSDPEEKRLVVDVLTANAFRRWIRNGVLGGTLIVVGEASAVAVLVAGTDGWLPLVAGPVCVVAILVSTVLAAWLPISQLRKMALLDRNQARGRGR
ncbi:MULTISPECIES: hypothetical protein [Catenuloplanes]|uniref:Uncharacterized protein n=1 Tax=Catenuloplanes niger TaxID=587534 RepID=A0AAE3ZW54_9ACTN|nr:hypothetical protein [Catenuloplanes niger]MDR7327108.1 hypothetical protein [Catenuloplanes niger]